jgi:sugar O-acyltransferase (sialic acid O-acetyltransferase NeuD family)
MQDIVIFGSGGMAREVAFLIEQINSVSPQWNILGFVELDRERIGQEVGKYRVYCTEEELLDKKVAGAIGIGTPAVIHKIASRFAGHSNISFPNLIHPSVVRDEPRVALGRGNILCARNIFTTDITIGSFNIFNLNGTYAHDVRIADCCMFNSGVKMSGGVEVGSRCMVGAGATILQYLKIGDEVTVGAGSVVTKDVPAGTTVVGVPAKPFNRVQSD